MLCLMSRPFRITTINKYKTFNMAQKRSNCEINETEIKKAKPSNFWALGLLDSMNDPKLEVKSDDQIVIIKDKYPKATFHYLVLPKENISNLKKLTEKHIKLLEHMETEGKKLIESDKHKNSNFKFGYHAEASMHRLHLHIISDDMISSCLKNKKHWNTFTTDFFLDSKAVLEDLKSNGKITIIPSAEKLKKYINTPLICNKCDFIPKNLPKLKEHLISHQK